MTARDLINTGAKKASWAISNYGTNGTGQYIRPDGNEMICVWYSVREGVSKAYRRDIVDGQGAGEETKFPGRGVAQQVIAYMNWAADDGFNADMAEMHGLVDKIFTACDELSGEYVAAVLGATPGVDIEILQAADGPDGQLDVMP